MTEKLSDLLPAYVRAFETLDPEQVLPFYHLPCMFLTGKEVALVRDPDLARGVVGRLMFHAQSQGYRRTEIPQLATRRLAADLAELTGVFLRCNAAGEEIFRFGFTYLVRRSEGKWRIAVAVAHDESPSEVMDP